MIVLLSTTNPTLVLNRNPRRKRLLLQMQAQVVDSGNTGRIHIGKEFQPVATVGHNAQGVILTQGTFLLEEKEWAEDSKPYKGGIWVTSSQNNQSLVVEEDLEEEQPATPTP